MAPKTYAEKKRAEDAAKFARDTGTRVGKGMQTQRQSCDPRSWEAVCKTAPPDKRVNVASYPRMGVKGPYMVSAHCRNEPLKRSASGARRCDTYSAGDRRLKAQEKRAAKKN